MAIRRPKVVVDFVKANDESHLYDGIVQYMNKLETALTGNYDAFKVLADENESSYTLARLCAGQQVKKLKPHFK